MKIGERKSLKPQEVIFLLLIIAGMIAGLYHYRTLFLKKSANMFDAVMKNTMDQAKLLSTDLDLAKTMRGVLGAQQIKKPQEQQKPEVKRMSNFTQGIECINQGDDQKAREYLRLAIDEQENDPEPHFWRE